MRHTAILAAALILATCGGSQPGERPPAAQQAAQRERGAPIPVSQNMSLPRNAGAWTRPDAPKRIDETGIFSYMDGAGELYVGYRFDHLDAYEYSAPGRDPILVELYWMRSSDDAFGLLSNDWGGEPVALQPGGDDEYVGAVPPGRALYGAGLLRLWSDTLYARVLAARETPESREQVLALGRAIVAGRPFAPRPALLRLLPLRAGQYAVRRDRAWFLRSHLVLNSAYFLASDNILDLSLSCDAAIAPYEATGKVAARRGAAPRRPQILVVQYPDAVAARAALAHFLRVYLPQTQSAPRAAADATAGARRIERGWIGYRLNGPVLAVAFDAPDEGTAQMLVAR